MPLERCLAQPIQCFYKYTNLPRLAISLRELHEYIISQLSIQECRFYIKTLDLQIFHGCCCQQSSQWLHFYYRTVTLTEILFLLTALGHYSCSISSIIFFSWRPICFLVFSSLFHSFQELFARFCSSAGSVFLLQWLLAIVVCQGLPCTLGR